MNPPETDALRREVKKKMVDLGLDRRGSYDLLIPRLKVSRAILSMTLTGYRKGPAAWALLNELSCVLDAWPARSAASAPLGERIHDHKVQNN